MFICEKCRALTQPGVKSSIVVVETRLKKYPRREHAHRQVGRDEDTAHDPGGTGVEAVKCARVCPACR